MSHLVFKYSARVPLYLQKEGLLLSHGTLLLSFTTTVCQSTPCITTRLPLAYLGASVTQLLSGSSSPMRWDDVASCKEDDHMCSTCLSLFSCTNGDTLTTSMVLPHWTQLKVGVGQRRSSVFLLLRFVPRCEHLHSCVHGLFDTVPFFLPFVHNKV